MSVMLKVTRYYNRMRKSIKNYHTNFELNKLRKNYTVNEDKKSFFLILPSGEQQVNVFFSTQQWNIRRMRTLQLYYGTRDGGDAFIDENPEKPRFSNQNKTLTGKLSKRGKVEREANFPLNVTRWKFQLTFFSLPVSGWCLSRNVVRPKQICSKPIAAWQVFWGKIKEKLNQIATSSEVNRTKVTTEC